jgi:NAD(P)-dependent dehydrogenase (short-subunit alcohol dehydrogenase family)
MPLAAKLHTKLLGFADHYTHSKTLKDRIMKWTTAEMPSLEGKIAIVTGANSGLGLYTSIGLAEAGATVIMACRDPIKAATSLQEVREQAPDGTVETMALDLASLDSVKTFAAAFSDRFPQLDILCNNAGVMAVPYAKTRDGFEMQIGTNHFGHFALTGRLLDKLNAAPAARVVNVASMAHNWTRAMDLDDPFFEHKRYSRWDAYGKSKLANLLFTFELDRRLKKAGARTLSAAAHPGYSATNLGFVGPALEKSAVGKLAMSLGNALFAQPASMGALPTLYAAADAGVAGGDYIGPDGLREMRGYPKKVGCRKLARDEDLQGRLWKLSEKLTGVQYL